MLLLLSFSCLLKGSVTPSVSEPMSAELSSVVAPLETPPPSCLDMCLKSKTMEARAIEDIESDCRKACEDGPPILPLHPPDDEKRDAQK